MFNFTKNKFLGALELNVLFPPLWRARLLTLSVAGGAVSAILGFLSWAVKNALVRNSPELGIDIPQILSSLGGTFFLGIFTVLLAPALFILALEGYFNSKTYDKSGDIGDPNTAKNFNFFASVLWFTGPGTTHAGTTGTLFSALPQTAIGIATLSRLGITAPIYTDLIAAIEKDGGYEPLDKFIASLGTLSSAPRPGNTAKSADISFADILAVLLAKKTTKEFLDAHEITQGLIRKTAEWMEDEFAKQDRKRRWWLPENLARIPGFAKDWAFGSTPLLQKFSYDLEAEALKMAGTELIGLEREIEMLETALLKQSGANIVVTGEAGSGKYTVLLGLTRMIAWGQIFPGLEHKRVFKLQGPSLIASGKTKGETEEIFIRLMNETVSAGNVILAIDEFPEFVDSLSKVGVNAVEILSPYLAHSGVHILALADAVSFRRILEQNAGLMKYFERIEIKEPDTERLMEILKNHAPSLEASYEGDAIFTYPALEKIAQCAIDNLVTGALPKRAIDLMEDVMKGTLERGLALTSPKLVMEIVTQKTKIPLGEIKPEEKEKLLGLEEFLHKRVIGQDEAVKAVADAIRRARSGIQNPKRPIGTFLFLGPTGVGKTETAKALAEAYFENENAMVRFDMTEYQNEDSLEKLVGSFEKNEPGLLTSHMRSSPYALVLLDEFEKCNPKVKNLFLQVLDEGFFSDHTGSRVNMRNTIIIATSNAGAKLIWEMVEKGADPSSMKSELLTSIQKDSIYSPELLNRFDAVIIYHPLKKEILTEIARMGLEKLARRLEKTKNLKFKITDLLVDAVSRGGYDPVFGARPMQRFIQDKVEKLIADKIIKGEVKAGDEVSFSPEEIASL